jgi:DNA polymerase V
MGFVISVLDSRRAARLEKHGIRTCLELRDACGLFVKKLLTITGHDLWMELNGHPVTPIRTNRTPHKMLARGGSLAGRVTDPSVLHGWLVRNLERLIEELQYHEVRPGTLSVALAYHDADPAMHSIRLSVPTERFDVLLDAARLGLQAVFRPRRIATHMHVIASNLRRAPWQHSLFDAADPRLDAIARVKREINERYGRWKIRSGATLFANKWYNDPSNEFEICDVRGKFCF